MKVELNLSSFRFRIILALIVIITSISFLSFYIYNRYLSQRIYGNAQESVVTSLTLLRDQIIAVHDGRIIKSSLKKIEENKNVWRTFLINSDKKVIYPEEQKHISRRLLATNLDALKEDITLQTTGTDEHKYFRAIIRMRNGSQCYSCHSPLKSVLGYIVVDFPLTESTDTIQFARNSSILFTIIMVILILGFVFFLHYRFVKKSLFQFRSTINIINSGNLDQRIQIPSSKELGELGASFNRMVEHFQFNQNELARYHEMEIRNSQKLASIGEMSARLAHEIRNPVTGIANAIEILNNELKDNGNRPILEEIKRQANRVDKAISNLLKYSRSKELNPQIGDINEIIKSVVFFLENQASNKRIRFILLYLTRSRWKMSF
jgi:two-component system NtrC family sensor kinase